MLRSPTPADAGRLAASVGRRKRLDADLIIAGVKILGTLIAAVLVLWAWMVYARTGYRGKRRLMAIQSSGSMRRATSLGCGSGLEDS